MATVLTPLHDDLAAPALPTADKRWCDRTERWRRPGDTIDPRRYGVEIIAERAARAFVVHHHYSGTYPAARLAVGLFHKPGLAPAALVGVAVFSVPVNAAAIRCHTGLTDGVDLGRFVCLPSVPYNGESWFLRRAFGALAAEKPDVRAVVSYSDPMERHDAAGLLTKPGHVGTIYQASNAAFRGRTAARWVWVTSSGGVVSPRALAKIAAGDCGQGYAAEQLVAAGGSPRWPGEPGQAWLRRVLAPPVFRKLRHPGNFVYAFGLDNAARDVIRGLELFTLPYPKRQAGRGCIHA